MNPYHFLRQAWHLWKSDKDYESYIAILLVALAATPFLIAWWDARQAQR
ncbi:hypothetical protein [Haloferax volcanii]|nr:hypothetical protein [Haloferax alexandrinus]